MTFFNPLLHSYWYLFRGAGMTLLMAGASVVPATVGSSRVDLQACKLEYSIVSPK